MRGEKPSLKATCYFLNTKGSKEPTCNAGNLARMWVWLLGQETILEKEMATHSSILAWKIPWTAHGVGKVRHDLVTKQQTRTSKTMLNKSDQSRHLCSIPDLRGNTFSFAHLGIIWPLLCWGKFPLCPLSGEYFFFYHKWCWICWISACMEMIIWLLLFSFSVGCIILIDLQILKNPCIPR